MTKQTKKRPSLQALLQQRQRTEFVGRAEQLDSFRTNLGLSLEDPRRKFVINVFGQGGVGKTTLLGQFRRIAEEMGHGVALTDENEDDVPEVMGRWAAELKNQGFAFKEFDERYKVYRQKREELEADPQAPQGFTAFAARTATRVALHTVKHTVPGSGLVLDLVDTEAASTQAGEWAEYIHKRLRDKDDVRLILEPDEVLTPLFLAGVQAEEKPAALICDTYEHTSIFLDHWLRALLDGRHGEIPGDLLLVIGGRDELARNAWATYLRAIAHISLEPFSEQEARDYLFQQGITNEQVIEVILKLSGLLPVLLATLAAESPNDPAQVGDVSGTAVERFLGWVDDPVRRRLALRAALPRYFNKDIMRLLVPENVDDLFEWLKKMPFVKEQPGENGWAYHDVVREQMLRYQRRESAVEWNQVHEQLQLYYESRREALGLDQDRGLKDEVWQSYVVATMYHRLCKNPQVELGIALNGFLDALRGRRSFARRWAEGLTWAGQDNGDETLRRWGERVELGLRAYETNNYPAILEMFSSLVENKLIEANANYAWAIASRGATYLMMAQYEPALADFNRAIELDANMAWAIASRGQTYLMMAQYEPALADFNRAIELDANMAWAIASRGQTYLMMAQYEPALADFNRAIELDANVAWAIASRGQTYLAMAQYEPALADFNRAIELDANMAWAIASRGQTYLMMAQYEPALADFNRAIELDANMAWAIARRGATYLAMAQYEPALADFNRAIELDANMAWAIASRGQTYLMMAQYEPALADFNRAIELDANMAWAIASRGQTYLMMAQYEPALADFNRAIELDANVAWAIASRGQTYLAMAQYEPALADFNRAIELDASDWKYYLRAVIYLVLSKASKARDDLSKAIQQAEVTYQEKPKNWWNTFNLAIYYLADRQLEKAEQLYQKALSDNPPNNIIQEAINDLEEYLALFPSHQAAQEIVTQLRLHLESGNEGK